MRERGHAVFVLSDQLGAFGLAHRAPPRLQYSSGPRRAATSVTGSDSYVLRVIATSVGHLEAVIETLGRFGTPTTSIILSSPVAARAVAEPPVTWPLARTASRRAAERGAVAPRR